MDKIGLVTITYNSDKVIADFITSVNNQSYSNTFLYVVDNNSSDDTLELLNKNVNPAKTILIRNDFNNGVAGGNNQGIKRALEDGCRYVVLINNDTEFEPDLVTKLHQSSIHLGHRIIVPKMMFFSSPDTLWFAGGAFNKWNGYINYHEGIREKDQGQYKDRIITYAPTCCALIEKSVFEEIGLMDEKYFVYFDDTDFWYRVLKNGKHKMFYISNVSFYHKVGSLTKSKNGNKEKFKFGDFAIKYSTRNRVYYLRKQKSILAYLNILVFLFRINARFLVSGKYNIKFKTWLLIQSSFYQGLKL